MTNQCCGLAVVFHGFILVKSINITEIFPGLHGFMGKTKTGLAKIIPHLTSSSPFKKRFSNLPIRFQGSNLDPREINGNIGLACSKDFNA